MGTLISKELQICPGSMDKSFEVCMIRDLDPKRFYRDRQGLDKRMVRFSPERIRVVSVTFFLI